MVVEWAQQAGGLYERVHQQYVGGARKLEALINELIGEEEGINYLSATARAKDPESFLAKASKPHPDDPARPKYDDPLNQITDLVAARVITFLVEAVDRVCEVIEAEFEIASTDLSTSRRHSRPDAAEAADRLFKEITGRLET
jgi:putative GTP pyrophosphokinase